MKIGTIILLILITGLILPLIGTAGKSADPNCSDCHSSLTQLPVVHKPLNRGCAACHKSNGKAHPADGQKGYDLTFPVPELCYECHDANNTKEHVHPPVANGKCTICHSPHSSEGASLIKITPVAKMCEECHDLELADKKVTHQPVVEGNCGACHDPHESDYKKLFKTEMPEACVKCHEPQRQELKLATVHPPFERNCSICHNGHGSNEDHLLSSPTTELCFGCHEDIQETAEQSPFLHPAMKDKKGCTMCHSPHASAEKKLLVAEETKVCTSCHNKSVSAKNTPVLNIKKLLQDSKFIHGAITKNGCSACHSPHGGSNKNLLTATFPAGKYSIAVKDSFALCFTCHDSKLIESETGTAITGFRSGDINLHFKHTNGKKGRSCTNCHDVHASNNEHLIVDRVAFGSWNMPVGFKPQEGGGSCAPGCHEFKEYKR